MKSRTSSLPESPDLLGDLLAVLPELLLLALSEELAVHLDLDGGDLVQDVLEGEEERPVVAEEQVLVLAVEDDVDHVAPPRDLGSRARAGRPA